MYSQNNAIVSVRACLCVCGFSFGRDKEWFERIFFEPGFINQVYFEAITAQWIMK